jgi:hypothetical protein
VIVGYCRTSTVDQRAGLEAQERDLKAAGAEKCYREQSLACFSAPSGSMAMRWSITTSREGFPGPSNMPRQSRYVRDAASAFASRWSKVTNFAPS